MPEGPEVSYLAHGLTTELSNRTLNHVDIVNGRYNKHGPPAHYTDFMKALPLTLLRVTKKGKVLFFEFDKGWTMISKLGMTGWWTLQEDPSRGANVRFVFEDSQVLCFSDLRNFGTLQFTTDARVVEAEKNRLAPDVLCNTTTWDVFSERIRLLTPAKMKMLIDDLLMDQTVLVSGIGNYLKSECLYTAQISPERVVSSLSQPEWRALYDSLRATSKRVLNDLKKLKINQWTYGQQEESTTYQVYSRKEDPIGRTVYTRKNKQGRTTYWVPGYQK
jgi:endonuclease VIII